MSNTGRMKYVPKAVMDRLFSIKKKKGLNKDSEAWNQFLRLSEVGGNVDDFYSQLFGVKEK